MVTNGLVRKIDRAYISSHIELVRLLRKGEGINDLLGWSGEQVLMRWLNYHLYRAGDETVVKNFGGDLKDCVVYTKVLRQILPRQTNGIAAILETSNLVKRAEGTLQWVEMLGVKTEAVKTKDIANGLEGAHIQLVAHLFLQYPSIRMPSEAEIGDLFNQLDELRVQLRDCNEQHDILQTKAKYIEIDLDELQRREATLRDAISAMQQALQEKAVEFKTTSSEKDREIEDAAAALAAKDQELEAMNNELCQLQKARLSAKDIRAKTIAENKGTIFQLEENVVQLTNANEQLRKLYEGKGTDLGQLQVDLQYSQEAVRQTTQVISDYLASSCSLLDRAAVDVNVQLVPPAADADELDRLRANQDTQEKVLKGFEEVLDETAAQHARLAAEDQTSVNDINRTMADCLGEEHSETEDHEQDGIANIKRLLDLMTEKYRSQQVQVQNLEVTIEKKNYINNLMAEKIRVIAEEATRPMERGKLQRKRPILKS